MKGVSKFFSAKDILKHNISGKKEKREKRMQEIYGNSISYTQIHTLKKLAKIVRKNGFPTSPPVLYYLIANLKNDLFGILDAIAGSKKFPETTNDSNIFFCLDFGLDQQKTYSKVEKKMNEVYPHISINITPNVFVRGRSFHGKKGGIYLPDITNSFVSPNGYDLEHFGILKALLTRPGDVKTIMLLDVGGEISSRRKIAYLRKKFGNQVKIEVFPFSSHGEGYSVNHFSELPEGDSDLARLGAKLL